MDDFEERVIDRLARIEEAIKAIKPLPDRVTALERWRDRILGAMAVLSLLWAPFVALLVRWYS